MPVNAGAGLSGDPGAIGANRSNFHYGLVPRGRSELLVNACQTFAISRQCDRECCGFDRGWFLRLALDQPDDLIVGSAGSTGEVEAISIPSASPPPIARLKPVPGVPRRLPLCPSRHPPQSVAACLSCAARRSSLAWAPSHARRSTAHRSGQRQSGRRKHARKPTGSPSRRGTSACSAFRVRRSHRRRWATRSTPGLAISK